MGTVLISTASVIPCAAGLAAQETIDLSEFDSCSSCSLSVALEARLGDGDGPGLIWGQLPAPVYEPATDRYAVFSRGGEYVSLFDGEGRFDRSIGRAGQGPGELRNIVRVNTLPDGLLVLNYGNQRWSRFSWDGSLTSEMRFSTEPGEVAWVHPDSVLIGVMGKSRSSAGYPLHVVPLSDGTAARHFGSTGRPYSATGWEPLMAVDPRDDSIWLAWPLDFRFERWSREGELLSVVEGRPDWSPRPTPASLSDPEPDVYMRHFAIDGRGWLVVLSHTADEMWESAVTSQGYVTDGEAFSASRIDVWDLDSAAYLGTHEVPEWEASLLNKGTEVLVNVPEVDTQLGSLTLGLYRLDPPDPDTHE